MSTRCVINIMDWKGQINAIGNMIACLKPKGTLLLMESCEETFNECDRVRSKFGLEKLERPWHNKFLNIKKTSRLLEKNFEKVYTSSMGVRITLYPGLYTLLLSIQLNPNMGIS